MASSRGPVLLYVLPLLSVLVLGVSLFFGTDASTVRYAVVLGGPTDSGKTFRGRLQVVEETHGVGTPVVQEPLVLEAHQGVHVLERRVVTGASGWTEFELPLRPSPVFELRVSDQMGRPLARGKPVLETGRWIQSARRRGGDLGEKKSGAVEAHVSFERGVFAVPFPGRGVLSLTQSDLPGEAKPLTGAQVRLAGNSALLRGAPSGATDAAGRFSFEVAPQHHVSSLHVAVSKGELKWEFEQVLPVVPGAFGLTEVNGGLVVKSPVPRDEAWFTFVTEMERLVGGQIQLSPDSQGFFSGEIPGVAIPKTEGLFVVLASSADGRSPSTVGYPLDGQQHTLDIWDGYLLDGGDAARSRSESRRRKVRWTLAAYAGLSGLLTLLLLVLRVRKADQMLAERLQGVGATKETRESSLAPLMIAVIGLFFAFSAGVIWIVAR